MVRNCLSASYGSPFINVMTNKNVVSISNLMIVLQKLGYFSNILINVL